MQLRLGWIERCGVLLFGGYLLFFLLRHDPYPRAVPGLLAIALPDYVRATAQFNPTAGLSHRLGISAALFISIGLLSVLIFLFVVYFRMLQEVRNQSQQEVGALGEHLRSYTKSHEEEPNVVAMRGHAWSEKTSDRRASLVIILAGVVLFSLPLLLCPYLISGDIYSYIMYGRIAALYGENPALTAPSVYARDAFFPYQTAWQSTPSVYGPLWALLSHGITLLVERAGGALWLYLLAYKLAMLAAHLANTVLIWQIVRAWRPGQQRYAALLYAWNPVALIEFVGNAHNDVLMIGLILLAMLCMQRGYWRLALLALLGAALVKWVAVLLLPLCAIYWLSRPSTYTHK